MEYQKELLFKEWKQVKKALEGQVYELNNLDETRKKTIVKEMVEKANQSYCQMCNIGGRLKLLVEKEKSEEIQAIIEANGGEVNKVEIRVNQWLEAFEVGANSGTNEMKSLPQVSDESSSEDIKNKEDSQERKTESPEMKMWSSACPSFSAASSDWSKRIKMSKERETSHCI